MVEISFKNNKIQKGQRIKIPEVVLDTLGLKEGDKIVIKLDPINKKFTVEEQKK
jgi:bifunctional DNA-binding transcriptional regulator/antitoxin component of YhaV-PrlF toxin-antitoxin module